MVAIVQRICDVTLVLRNRQVPATAERRVNVPALGTPNNEAVRFKVDVSDNGANDLDALVREAKKKTIDAWAPVLALVENRKPATPKKAKTATQPPLDEAPADGTVSVAEPATSNAAEA